MILNLVCFLGHINRKNGFVLSILFDKAHGLIFPKLPFSTRQRVSYNPKKCVTVEVLTSQSDFIPSIWL
jgi:hypothetical protein